MLSILKSLEQKPLLTDYCKAKKIQKILGFWLLLEHKDGKEG